MVRDFDDTRYTVSLPKDIKLMESTQEDIISVFGEPTSTYSGNASGSCTFSFDDGKWGFRFSRLGKLNVVSINNESISKEFTRDLFDEEQTEEVAEQYGYATPQELGDDLMSGIVEYGGNLYWMVCPLNAMLKNGWSVSPLNAIDCLTPGESVDSLELIRNGKRQKIAITNFVTETHCLENCLVTGIIDMEGNLVLPGGIRVGMTENDCAEVIKESGYSIYDSEIQDSVTWYYIYGMLSSSIEGRIMLAMEDGILICIAYDAYEISN